MHCWLITFRSEIRRLEFDTPPDELCLPDKPLGEMDAGAGDAIQDAPYIVYTKHSPPSESGLLGFVYSLEPPTAEDLRLILDRSD
jgi:hypothetical protein